jgi:RND family efflux transporter MFP subunit
MILKDYFLCFVCAALLASSAQHGAHAAENRAVSGMEQPLTALFQKPAAAPQENPSHKALSAPIKSVVIIPFRSADIPAEVKGAITKFYFDKGDLVTKDQPVVEISKERYSIMLHMAKSKLEALKQSLGLAEQNLQFKKDVYSKNYGTRQKLLEAQAEVSVTKQRVEEAKRELELARLNLDCCVVKAPFTGYIVEKYKETYEAVNQLDKLFRIVDTRKVYAVANVPELLLATFKKSSPSFFVDSAERRYRGSVDKIEPILCPESKTAKVFVLLENAQSQLKVGMTGALWSE